MNWAEEDKGKDHERWALIDSKAKEHRLVEIFSLLEENRIEAVVLKGWSVARFYPSNSPRTYTDIDIAVASEQYEAVDQLLRHSSAGTHVDLHNGLRGLDNLEWPQIISRTYRVDLNGTPIRVLSDEDNLRITATHWLTDGGVYREKLWDIFYLVQSRGSEFDWVRCLDSNGEVRKTWTIAAIRAAIEYLDLESASLPTELRNSKLPGWFRQTLEREWRLGPYPRIPLKLCLHSPRLLLEQVRRRVPPNTIAASIEMEQPIDQSSRTIMRLRSALKRARPLFTRRKVSGDL